MAPVMRVHVNLMGYALFGSWARLSGESIPPSRRCAALLSHHAVIGNASSRRAFQKRLCRSLQ